MASKLWWVLLIAACGAVPPDARPEASAGVDAAAPDAPAAPDGIGAVLDRSCAEVKARLGTATDAVHWIDPDLEGAKYQPFQVFCAGMASATPAEYLELVKTSPSSGEPTSNFATYATGADHAAWHCDCGIATTLYSKVRIDPVTLRVTASTLFAVFSASTQVACLQTKSGCPGPEAYAVAQSCIAQHFAGGRANIDLRGTPFHLAGTDASMFKRNEEFNPSWGFTSEGSAAIDGPRKVIALTGGGDCGGFGALDGIVLAQD